MASVKQQKQQVEQQLAQVRQEQSQAVTNLEAINLDFEQSKQQLKQSAAQARKLRQELDNLLAQRQDRQEQLAQLQQRSQELQQQLQQREQQIAQRDRTLAEQEARLEDLEEQRTILQQQVQERDRSIAQLDEAIANAESSLKLRTQRLEQLEAQLDFLSRNVEALEQSRQQLRQKKIAIVKGQVLSSAVVRIVDPDAAQSVIGTLLRQANKNALKATQFNDTKSKQRIVKMTSSQGEKIESQIKDGRDYVLRIISAENYVQGEQEIRVFADLALNRQVFTAGEEIATISIDSRNLTRRKAEERLNWLLSVSKFRAQRAGILGDIQIGNNQIESVVKFINQITQTTEPVDEIKAVVVENTYTAGPLKLNFVALRNGKVVFSTGEGGII